MSKRKRAMSSKQASEVKTSGHVNEHEFATLIGGSVHKGSHTDKADVIDKRHQKHSIKSGKWWQVFLYGREKLKTNTIFQGLGNVADIMIECIDAYPLAYEDYQSNKLSAKLALQGPMKKLLQELQQKNIYRAFLEKALFDGGSVKFLSIYPGPAKDPIEKKKFHVFHHEDVIDMFSKCVEVQNSRARQIGQMNAQKVVFRSLCHNKNIGEIEDRHDSSQHYREMKFRLNSKSVLALLTEQITNTKDLSDQVVAYGKSINTFKI